MTGGRLELQEVRAITSRITNRRRSPRSLPLIPALSLLEGRLAGGLTYAEIARRLKWPTSTVTREVMRHGGPGAYHADQAQRAADRRVHHRTTTPAAARGDADAGVGGRDLRTVREVADQLTDLLVQGGIPQMMAKMLATLYTTDSGSLTSAELVQHLQVSPASISKAVGYLEAQELIRRERDPGAGPSGTSSTTTSGTRPWWPAPAPTPCSPTPPGEAPAPSARPPPPGSGWRT